MYGFCFCFFFFESYGCPFFMHSYVLSHMSLLTSVLPTRQRYVLPGSHEEIERVFSSLLLHEAPGLKED